MISAGNDIVSFAVTNFTRTSQSAFYNKILSQQEITSFKQHTDLLSFEVYVWLLWSVKEAGYKYLKRLYPNLVFSPTRSITKNISGPAGLLTPFEGESFEGTGFADLPGWTGTVTCNGHKLHFYSLLFADTVHTVVNSASSFDHVCWGIKAIADAANSLQSAAVREFLLARLQAIVGYEGLQVLKDQYDIPLVVGNDPDIVLPVSFSHHGRYVAYSFGMPGSAA